MTGEREEVKSKESQLLKLPTEQAWNLNNEQTWIHVRRQRTDASGGARERCQRIPRKAKLPKYHK